MLKALQRKSASGSAWSKFYGIDNKFYFSKFCDTVTTPIYGHLLVSDLWCKLNALELKKCIVSNNFGYTTRQHFYEEKCIKWLDL